MNGVIYVSDSGNSKLKGKRKVDATYASIKATCPNSCPLKDKACYSQLSYSGITVSRIDKEASNLNTIQVAKAEALAIDNAYNGGSIPNNRDMRLHVSGDSRTLTGTRIINKAIGRWKKRGGGDCWSYTHSWRNIPRSEWSNVSILASITSASEVEEAKNMGYAPAIIVSEFDNSKAFKITGSNVNWIPCPAQTSPGGKDISCVDCRLCFNDKRLLEGNFGIAFAAHGVRKNEIKRQLKVLK